MNKMTGTRITNLKDSTRITLITEKGKKKYVGKNFKWKDSNGNKLWNIFKILKLKRLAEENRCTHC